MTRYTIRTPDLSTVLGGYDSLDEAVDALELEGLVHHLNPARPGLLELVVTADERPGDDERPGPVAVLFATRGPWPEHYPPADPIEGFVDGPRSR